MGSVVTQVRAGVLDTELAALVWLLAGAGVPAHVAGADQRAVAELAEAIRALAREPSSVSSGSGDALEEVLRQPVPLRPATGAVLILADARVVAAHFQRPPLRDAGGHVRPQGPAVLATWDGQAQAWEHFAWGITPELADAAGRKAGDLEIELRRRREFLEALVEAPLEDEALVQGALRSYGLSPDPRA